MKFAFIYAMPGYEEPVISVLETQKATFIAMSVDIENKEEAAVAAKRLVDEYQVDMIELCGGLADAHIVSKVKSAISNTVPVGAVTYGPESRRPLVDLLNL